MENRAHALAAGLFIVLLFAASIAAVVWFGGSREASVDYLVVTRQSISGLSAQGQVRYRGMRVGRIEAISIDPENARNILIRISVQKDLPLTEATVARLGYQGVTGIAHIALDDDGSSSRPLGAAGGLAHIPMQPSFMQEISESGSATLREAEKLLRSINGLFSHDNRQRLENTLASIEKGSALLAATLERAEQIIADPRFAQLGASVAGAEAATREARQLIGEARQIVPRVAGLVDKIDAGVVEGKSGVALAGARLNELGEELAQTSRQLRQTLQFFEAAPQSLLFGPPPLPPGPGEAGFVSPESRP